MDLLIVAIKHPVARLAESVYNLCPCLEQNRNQTMAFNQTTDTFTWRLSPTKVAITLRLH